MHIHLAQYRCDKVFMYYTPVVDAAGTRCTTLQTTEVASSCAVCQVQPKLQTQSIYYDPATHMLTDSSKVSFMHNRTMYLVLFL